MKMYKQPTTEVLAVQTARMMQDVTVSTNAGGGGGQAHAPKRGDIID